MVYVSSFLLLTTLTLVLKSYGVKLEYKAEYFQNTTLYCNDKVLNLPYTPFKIYWILPDESVLQPNDITREEKYIVGRPPNYNLTILTVDDDDYDRYYCVILWDNSIYLVHTIIVDLEVDGDEFEEVYRRNAIIGGIAGAATLTVMCLGCLVYWCRYKTVSSKIQKRQEEIKVIQVLDLAVNEFDETTTDEAEPVLPPRGRIDDVKDDVTVKSLSVEINQPDEVSQNHDNRAFEIDNDGLVPFEESDIDRLPPYTLCDEYM